MHTLLVKSTKRNMEKTIADLLKMLVAWQLLTFMLSRILTWQKHAQQSERKKSQNEFWASNVFWVSNSKYWNTLDLCDNQETSITAGEASNGKLHTISVQVSFKANPSIVPKQLRKPEQQADPVLKAVLFHSQHCTHLTINIWCTVRCRLANT